MNPTQSNLRFTLRSLVLFVFCCGLLVGAGMRLWRYYVPAPRLLPVNAPASSPITAAEVAILARALQSPSRQTRLEVAIELRQRLVDSDQALPLLEQLMMDDEPKVRCEALVSIGQFGPEAAVLVDKLALALTDKEATVRVSAAIALSRLGSDARDAVPALVVAMDDRAVRQSAIRTLGQIGPSAASAVPALTDALQDNDPFIRADAIGALERIGRAAEPAVPQLAALLETGDAMTQVRIARALWQIGPSARAAVPALLAVLRSGSAASHIVADALKAIDRADLSMLQDLQVTLNSEKKAARIAAARLIRLLGTDAAPAIPDLVRCIPLELVDAELQPVATALYRIGAPSVPPLCSVLDDDAQRRVTAACTLAAFGPLAREAIPSLSCALKDNDPRVRASAVLAMGKIGPEAAGVLPQIVELFRDSDPVVRKQTTWALGEIGPAAIDAVPKLLTLIADEDRSVALGAIWSLGEIRSEPEQVMPVLMDILDNQQQFRHMTIEAIGKFGKAGKKAVPAISRFLPIPEYDEVAADALGAIGPSASEAVPELLEALTRNHSFGCWAAGRALRKVCPSAAREVVPKLVQRLQGEEQIRHEKAFIISALKGIGPEAEEAVPSLLQQLSASENDEVALALGEIGPPAKTAVPMLVARFLSGKVRPDFNWMYIVALGKIGPDAETAVPMLVQQLEASGRGGLATHAAIALGQIGQGAREAVPNLKELAQGGQPQIQVPLPGVFPRRGQQWFMNQTLQEAADEAVRRIEVSDRNLPETGKNQ